MTLVERRAKLQAELTQVSTEAHRLAERVIFLSGAIAVLNDMEKEDPSTSPPPSATIPPQKE